MMIYCRDYGLLPEDRALLLYTKNTEGSAWLKYVDCRQPVFFLRSVPITEKKTTIAFSATSNVNGVLQCCRHDSSIGESV